MYFALTVIGSCAVLYVALPLLVRAYLRRRFIRHIAAADCAFLTFDDGPDPSVTPKLLALLSRYDVKATFFVIGEKAERHPELIAMLIANGHEVAEHSYRHLHPWKAGPVTAAQDLRNGSAVLDALGLRDDGRLLRPPYGKLNVGSLVYLMFKRAATAYWTIDPQDFRRTSGVEVADLVCRHLRKGEVVLLHDGCGRNEDGTGIPVVLSAVERILEVARERRLTWSVLHRAARSFDVRAPAADGSSNRCGRLAP